MGIAIDTSALVTLERQGYDLIDALPADTGEVCVPAIVLAELWIGVELADSAGRRASRLRKVEALLDTTTSIPFDARVAPTYAEIYARLREAGALIPSNDLAIGSVAVHYGHELLVGPQDEGHFRRIPNLVIRVLGGD